MGSKTSNSNAKPRARKPAARPPAVKSKALKLTSALKTKTKSKTPTPAVKNQKKASSKASSSAAVRHSASSKKKSWRRRSDPASNAKSTPRCSDIIELVKSELPRLRARNKSLGQFISTENRALATKTVGLLLLKKGGRKVLFSGTTTLVQAVTGPSLFGSKLAGYQLQPEDCPQDARCHYIFGRPNNATVLVALPSWGINEYLFAGSIPAMEYLGCIEMKETSRGSNRLDGQIKLNYLSRMFPTDQVLALTASKRKRETAGSDDEDEKSEEKRRKKEIKELKVKFVERKNKKPEPRPRGRVDIVAMWEREEKKKAKEDALAAALVEKEAKKVAQEAARKEAKLAAEAKKEAEKEAKRVAQAAARVERAAKKAVSVPPEVAKLNPPSWIKRFFNS